MMHGTIPTLFSIFVLVLLGAPTHVLAEDGETGGHSIPTNEYQEEQGPGIAVTLSSTVWSKYVIGNGLIARDEPVLQNDLFVSLPYDFFIDVWWSVGLDGTGVNSDFGDEVDYTIGWSGALEEFNLTASFGYYDLFELGTDEGGDVFFNFLEVSRAFPDVLDGHTLTPYLNATMYFPHKWDVSDGVQPVLGLRHSWLVTRWLSANSDIGFIYDSGAFDFEPGFLWKYQGTLDWRLNDHLTLNLPQIKARVPLEPLNRREAVAVYGAAIIFNFDVPVFR